MKPNIPRWAFFALVFLITAAPAHAAGIRRAIVVGINNYPNLPDESQLRGCVDDARAVAGRLGDSGFRVQVLLDRAATRAGILGALRNTAKVSAAGDSFAFFFAGHGARQRDGSGVIVPSDYDFGGRGTLIDHAELRDAVNAVPAASRTVILDSCFSGAMSKAFTLGGAGKPGFRSRYLDIGLSGTRSLAVDPVSGRDDPYQGQGRICYFTAALPFQQAGEQQFGGVSHGVFTHALLAHLAATPEPWARVQEDVTAEVVAESGGAQTPSLSPEFVGAPVFGSAADPAPPEGSIAASGSLWNTFSADHADHTRIRLTVTPDRSTIAAGDSFTLHADTGDSAGYLVVLELDTDGSLDLLAPAGRDPDAARVDAHTSLRLPANLANGYVCDREGGEIVKAFLFSSRDLAQQLLDAFPDSRSVASWQDASHAGRDLVLVNATEYWTSTVGFEVSGVAAATPLQQP